jgi:hypothetical protein
MQCSWSCKRSVSIKVRAARSRNHGAGTDAVRVGYPSIFSSRRFRVREKGLNKRVYDENDEIDEGKSGENTYKRSNSCEQKQEKCPN